jgi:hypothetical protein
MPRDSFGNSWFTLNPVPVVIFFISTVEADIGGTNKHFGTDCTIPVFAIVYQIGENGTPLTYRKFFGFKTTKDSVAAGCCMYLFLHENEDGKQIGSIGT